MADPVVTNGDILELTFKAKVFEQDVMNKFHYRLVPSQPTITQQDLADKFDALISGAAHFYSQYKLIMPTNWNAQDNVYQIISPQRYVAINKSHIGEAGGNTFATLTANVAVCVTKRGSLAGRRNISTTHLLATDNAGFMEDGRITPFAAAALGLWKAWLKTVLEVACDAGDVVCTPVIYHPADPAQPTEITSVLTQQSVRVMRRRTLGIGS